MTTATAAAREAWDLIRQRDKARQIREQTLRLSQGRPHHLGGQLSCVEILVSIFYGHAPTLPDTRFVLSKGHACITLYAILADLGLIPAEELETIMEAGGRLLGHPCRTTTPAVDASTGSLGMGLSMAAGMALAARTTGRETHVHALLGDGEMQSGQVWEALMLMGHHQLDTVHTVIDCNGAQADGDTADIIGLEPLPARLEAMGLEAVECDGHDLAALNEALAEPRRGRPRVIVARTVKGKSVPMMEGDNRWHSGALSRDQLANALASLY
ncbi:transketolase [Kutzneria sp. CA-103260]|uniref:transketolase n=1 Tax=Kutzneria sp. CA-103260 TaxID=2802641 RepID=UPI001BA82570|nr:transketolase [Kutzneria sp. CA-103260]QUQ64984.1 transketolase [Kutzneria sp. CA-103260]